MASSKAQINIPEVNTAFDVASRSKEIENQLLDKLSDAREMHRTSTLDIVEQWLANDRQRTIMECKAHTQSDYAQSKEANHPSNQSMFGRAEMVDIYVRLILQDVDDEEDEDDFLPTESHFHIPGHTFDAKTKPHKTLCCQEIENALFDNCEDSLDWLINDTQKRINQSKARLEGYKVMSESEQKKEHLNISETSSEDRARRCIMLQDDNIIIENKEESSVNDSQLNYRFSGENQKSDFDVASVLPTSREIHNEESIETVTNYSNTDTGLTGTLVDDSLDPDHYPDSEVNKNGKDHDQVPIVSDIGSSVMSPIEVDTLNCGNDSEIPTVEDTVIEITDIKVDTLNCDNDSDNKSNTTDANPVGELDKNVINEVLTVEDTIIEITDIKVDTLNCDNDPDNKIDTIDVNPGGELKEQLCNTIPKISNIIKGLAFCNEALDDQPATISESEQCTITILDTNKQETGQTKLSNVEDFRCCVIASSEQSCSEGQSTDNVHSSRNQDFTDNNNQLISIDEQSNKDVKDTSMVCYVDNIAGIGEKKLPKDQNIVKDDKVVVHTGSCSLSKGQENKGNCKCKPKKKDKEKKTKQIKTEKKGDKTKDVKGIKSKKFHQRLFSFFCSCFTSEENNNQNIEQSKPEETIKHFEDNSKMSFVTIDLNN